MGGREELCVRLLVSQEPVGLQRRPGPGSRPRRSWQKLGVMFGRDGKVVEGLERDRVKC